MSATRAAPAILMVFALSAGACRADREAVEEVDLSPDPRIEQAPALPTPPVGAPVGLHPDTAPRDTVELDTIPGQ